MRATSKAGDRPITRGKVAEWTILQFFHKPDQTAVEWRFRSEMNDGTIQAFDGVSLVRWDAEGKICFLQEFGCNADTYDPYENGPKPQFRSEAALWF